jgi:N,N'-diacetyllegionaminate synthase
VPENHATLASVALGASVIEKHFTLDKQMEGPDHSSSLDVVEFTDLVASIRKVEAALGNGIKIPTAIEKENAVGMRRSIVASEKLTKGTVLTLENLCFKRPATGLNPMFIDELIGKKINKDLDQDEQLSFGSIEW